MDLLKMLFPLSFVESFDALLAKFNLSFGGKKEVTTLIVKLVLYVVAMILSGVVFGLLGIIPLVGLLFGLIGWAVGLYALAGLVLAVLDFFKVLK